MKRESLWSRHPDYRVDLVPEPRRMRVVWRGEVLADSRRSLRVEETRHEPVWYFPREDVRLERLQPSAHSSFCPFKGDASYWSVDGDENLVWSYEEPFPQVAGLRDHVAFWLDRSPDLRLEEVRG